MRLNRSVLLHLTLAGATVSAPIRALAQSRAELRALESLRDSVATVAGADTLADWRDAVRRLRESEAGGADPIVHLREGILEWRLAYLGDWGRSRDAEKAFGRAEDLRPSWSYPRFGHGLAKVAQADWQQANALNLGTRVGVGALERALEAFADAVARDPGFEAAQAQLAQTALRLRTPEHLETALVRLDSVMGPRGPEVDLLLGRLERRVGRLDAAVASFLRYRTRGANDGLANLELARTRLELGVGGDAAYYAGAASDDSNAVRGYRADIALIATESELAAYDTASGPDRVAFLRDFWAKRDHADLRKEGTRLAEHYRRLGYVWRHFWLDATRRHYWLGALYESGVERFDDRGVVYLRQGPPTQRVTPRLFGATGNESWRYHRPDGDLILHFCAQGDLRDYRLIASALDVLGGRCNTGGVQTDQLLSSRQELSPIYAKIGTWGPFGQAKMVALERAIGEHSATVGTTTDRFELRYSHPLQAVVRPLAVGRVGERSLVHLVLAVGGWDSLPAPTDGVIDLRIRFAAFDSAGAAVALLDTSVVRVVRGPVAGSYLLDRVALPVPAGSWTYRLALERDDSTGVLFPTDSLTVPDFAAAAPPVVSDLMIGRDGIPLVWRPTPVDTAYLDPRHRYRRNDRLELYYEVYGVAPGETYESALDVRGTDDGGFLGLFRQEAPDLSFTFREVARGDVIRAHRTVALADLEPGTYRLVVAIRSPAGVEATRSATIEVLP